MWFAEEVVVISDLHLAAERGRGLFQADDELAGFLNWVRQELRRCHLILNGDAFDFLEGQREDAPLSPDTAAAQVAAMAESHHEVFKSLSLLANSGGHEVVVLGGNHDPELALPSVQREVERRLGPACAHPPLRWLTNGEAASLKVGEARLLVEHGDQYDAWNWVDHEALRRVVCLTSRGVPLKKKDYTAPPGSRLVINRFNHIGDRFPWLQTLQPFNAVLLPLALEVILPSLERPDRDRLLEAVREMKDVGVRSATDLAVRGADPRSAYWAEDEAGTALLNEWLSGYKREEDTWGLVGDAKAAAGRAARRLRALAARAALRRASRRDTFFDLGAADSQLKAAGRLMPAGADLVVHGHTHAAKAYKLGPGLYLNTGTWGRLSRLPSVGAGEGQWAAFLEGLRVGRAETFSRPTFARVSSRGGKTYAGLYAWAGGRAEPRSTWVFEKGRWQKERDQS